MSDVNSARRWNPDTNEWEVVKEGEGDIVGTGVNYAGVTVPALESVDIAPTTKLMRDSGEFQDLDVAGTTVLHGKLKVQGALSTKWFDASPTAGATVCYLDFENGPQQYLYLTADTTVWLPTTNQSEGFFSLCVEQDAVGGWDITWKINVAADGSAACPWPDGIDPVMDPDPSAVEVYQFTWCQNLNSGNGAYVGMPVQALTIPPAVGADARKAPVLSAISSELFRPNIIRIAWSYTPGLDYIENAIEFELQRKEAQYLDGNGDVITPLVWGDYAEIYAGTDYTYTDVGLDRTHKYLYRVRASSRFTEAGYSAWLELAAAVQPSGVLAMDVQANELYNRLTTGGVLSSHIGVAAVTADKIYAGALLAYGVNVVNRLRGCTVKFSHLSDHNVVWNSGHLLLAKATYTADPGQSASLTDVSWGTIELDITGSSKTLEHSTDYYAYVTWVEDTYGEPASIGNVLWSNTYPTGKNDIVLALVNINADGKVAVEPYGATGTVINGDHITTGSIDAVAIKAGTITADRLSASYIVVSGAAGDVNANKGVTTIAGDAITTGTITADRLNLVNSITLDTFPDGSTYGKVYKTAISSGVISLTQGVTGTLPVANSAAKCTDPNADQTSTHRAADMANLHATTDAGAGLYATTEGLGYWNGSAWSVVIKADGTAYFGGTSGANHIYWNGSTLTVRGNIEASSVAASISMSSPTITGGTLKTAADGNARMMLNATGQGTLWWYSSSDVAVGSIYMSGNDLCLKAHYVGIPDGYIQALSSIYLASGKGISFDGHSLYISGHDLMFGATKICTFS